MAIGLYFSFWFFKKFLNYELDIYAVLYAVTTFIVAMIHVGYKNYVSDHLTFEEVIEAGKRELLAVVPLVLAAIVALYFLAKGQLYHVGAVLWPALVIWIILRIIISKRARKHRT